MQEKLNALNINQTWDIVPYPHGPKPIGCKWGFFFFPNSSLMGHWIDIKHAQWQLVITQSMGSLRGDLCPGCENDSSLNLFLLL